MKEVKEEEEGGGEGGGEGRRWRDAWGIKSEIYSTYIILYVRTYYY